MPNMQELAQQLVALSPAQYEGECDFHYFAVCNEFHWVQTYESLAQLTRPKTDAGVALVFGESHFISLLPLLSAKGIQLLVLADIQPLLHVSNKKLLDCLDASATRGQFIKNWHSDAEFFREYGGRMLCQFRKRLDENMLGQYHFLSSDARYLECKQAREAIRICQMEVDVYDSALTAKIADTVAKANTTIELLNLTNISCYDEGYDMKSSISHLLKYNPEATIVYSKFYPGQKGKLISQFARGFSEYKAFMDGRRKNDFNKAESELDETTNLVVTKFLNLASPIRVNFIRQDAENVCRVVYQNKLQQDQIFNVSGFFQTLQSVNFSASENAELEDLRWRLEDAREIYLNYAEIPGTVYHPEKIQYADLVLNKTRPSPQVVRSLSIIQQASQETAIQPNPTSSVAIERIASFV
jgi:hypothetical protein